MPDGATIPEGVISFALANRVAIERELGSRSLYEFFKMAWPEIDSARYIDNWHIRLLCDELQAAACRVHRNMAICIPPRHGKSLLVSVVFPAWVWTWWPSAKFITASYDIRLASRDAVACRRLVQSKWYRDRWGDKVQIAADQDQKTYYQTVQGGHRFVTSPGAGVTGFGADFILADDPHNVKQAESDADRASVHTFWFEAIPSRLNNPDQGVKIVIQQRVHEKDLAGECMRRGYHKVVLPARCEVAHPDLHPRDVREEGQVLWPDRMSSGTLNALAIEMGPYAAAGQLQQRPAPREGGLFERRWFKIEKAAPAEVLLNCVRRWDFAATIPDHVGADPDWTVGIKMGRDAMGRFWILDMQRFQETPAKVEQAVKAMAYQDGTGCTIGIPEDPGQAGKYQVQYMVGRLAPYTVRPERETGSKESRAEPFSAQCEVGNVILVDGPWVEKFLTEITAFPNGAHDDVVDAATGAFRMLTGGNIGMLDFMRMQADAFEGEWKEPSKDIIERHVLAI